MMQQHRQHKLSKQVLSENLVMLPYNAQQFKCLNSLYTHGKLIQKLIHQ